MTTSTTVLFLLLTATATTFCLQEMELLQMAQTQVSIAKNLVGNSMRLHGLESLSLSNQTSVALTDCAKLYGDSEFRLSYMISDENSYTKEDALTWISSVMTNHRTCLDGLHEKGYAETQILDKNLTMFLGKALDFYAKNKGKPKEQPQRPASSNILLASWSIATSKADFTVAQDGSGTHRTIREAVDAVASMGHNRPERTVIYVKSGVYHEKVEIGQKLHNVMFVGDGIDKTIVTGTRNFVDGSTTLGSASFVTAPLHPPSLNNLSHRDEVRGKRDGALGVDGDQSTVGSLGESYFGRSEVDPPSVFKDRVSFAYSSEKKDLDWLLKCMVGKTVETVDARLVSGLLKAEGLLTVSAHPIGGDLVLISPSEGDDLNEVLKDAKDWISAIFVSFQPWSLDLVVEYRDVWLHCTGIPLQAWSEKFFHQLGNVFGSLQLVDDETRLKTSFEHCRLLIRTRCPSRINQSLVVLVDGKKFSINVWEVLGSDEFGRILSKKGGCGHSLQDGSGSANDDSMAESDSWLPEKEVSDGLLWWLGDESGREAEEREDEEREEEESRLDNALIDNDSLLHSFQVVPHNDLIDGCGEFKASEKLLPIIEVDEEVSPTHEVVPSPNTKGVMTRKTQVCNGANIESDVKECGAMVSDGVSTASLDSTINIPVRLETGLLLT
ncbi:unnamed protein product [Lupinus luteus]|uniref:Pectinesterase inhibitor domain-containing protein n=1 Tax=Lupinus luteus TaxID=3873 RepID=A0AAV1XRW2_LUPLU